MRHTSIKVDDEIDRLAVVTDPHGFLEPLEEIDRIIAGYSGRVAIMSGGDLSGGGASPVEVLEWVRQRAGELTAIGNHDRYSPRRIIIPHPPYTDVGSFQQLSPGQLHYRMSMPDVLEISWRGKLIHLMHGDLTLDGRHVDWQTKPSRLMELFARPDVDLTMIGHTHWPFVREIDGMLLANCGAVGQIIFAERQADDSYITQEDGDPFPPFPQPYSTFLSVACEKGRLNAEVVRFDWNRQKETQRLQEAADPKGDPRAQYHMEWLTTGVCPPPLPA